MQEGGRHMPQHLPPKLQAVLVRLCRIASLNITQAVKLPYLVDVVSKQVLGAPITGGAHEAWEYGVVTSQAWRHLDAPSPDSPFVVKSVAFSDEKRVSVKDDADESLLSDEERQIVDYVASEFAALPASELGMTTKFMNPRIARWGNNHAADMSSNAFERMSWDYQAMAKDAASMTLDSLRRHSRPVETIEEMLA
jgi:hypothetical protein